MESTALWRQLEQVLDPELDESIVRLGFVTRLDWDGERARVALRLPTYWCSANFAYLMADGVRRALLDLPEVKSVEVAVEDHFAGDELTRGVTAGKGFVEIFPEESEEELEDLRRLFLVKGYLSRLLVLAESFRATGATYETLLSARLADLRIQGDDAWLDSEGRAFGPLRSRVVERYLTRRAELGLPRAPESPLLLQPDGRPIDRARVREEFRRLRATVINIRASTVFCEAVLASRNERTAWERKEAVS